LLNEALANVLIATDTKPNVPIYQLTLGYIYYLLDETDKSSAVLSDALVKGDKELRQGLLKFVSYCETPKDLAFKEFLNQISSD
jgi:hypothetical protein